MLANTGEEWLHFFLGKTRRFLQPGSIGSAAAKVLFISCRKVTGHLQLFKSKPILTTPAKNHPAAV